MSADFDNPHADGFYVSADPKLLDMGWVVPAITNSYWGTWRTPEIVAESIANSRPFGLFEHVVGVSPDRQVGFARVVTDGTTFSYLCDVVIDPDYRGRGLGKLFVSSIINSPALRRTVFTLKTRDAHGLYAKLGFYICEAMTRNPPPQ